MALALFVARLLLAVVFVIAGVAKLVDLKGSREAMRGFGLPVALANPFGVLLPLVELVVAVALIPLASAWWGAVGALVLVLLFIAGIVYNLARGRTPDCHCFGQLYSKPIGWPTLVRNALLAAVAGFIIAFGFNNPGLSAVAWFGTLAVAQRVEVIVGIVLVVLLIGAGWLLLEMLRQQGRLLLRIEALEERLAAGGNPTPPVATNQPQAGLPVGTPAPLFALSGLFGETITLDALRAADRPIILLFSDPGCGPCTALMPELGRWQRDYAGKLTLALISRGAPEANRTKSSEHGISGVLLQKDREVALAYQSNGTPSAVLIGANGTIGSPLAMGADAIRSLVAQAVGLPALRAVAAVVPANGNNIPVVAAPNGNGNGNPVVVPVRPATPKVGDMAPGFSLPNLSGRTVNLSDFRGNKVLVLFWNPGCGFCQRMLDDLKAWETSPPRGAPRLLVVSTGSVETNQALGLRAPVLLDENMSAGSKFGANGTPMAVMIDGQGKIVSELAAGAPAVLALAGA